MSQALPRAASSSFSQRLLRIYDRVGFLPIALVAVLSLFVPRFLSLQNVLNVLRSSSYLVIISAGQMMVLIVGGFDLSVDAVVPPGSVVSALTMVWANGVALVWFMQNFTRIGCDLYAIGGNLQAATVSGVRAKTDLVLVYAACSILVAVSGLALTAQIGSGRAVINAQLTLESIAAAVIAGASPI